MDKASLVITEIETGEEALRALDEAALDIKVAAWCVFPRYGDWRLVLASPKLDATDTFGGIRKVFEAFGGFGIPIHRQPDFMIMRMKDPFIRDLRRRYGKTGDVVGMRLGLQSFGGQFLEDGYAYRIQ